jgi:hypothetical protein
VVLLLFICNVDSYCECIFRDSGCCCTLAKVVCLTLKSYIISPVYSYCGRHVYGAGHECVCHRVEVGHGVREDKLGVASGQRGQRKKEEGAKQLKEEEDE